MEEGKSKSNLHSPISNLHSPISNLHSPLHGDSVSTRFGFREFWIEGPDFFLNGAKIHLLAASTWPSVQPQSRQEVEQTLRQIKAAHCVCFRTHTQPWRKVWYEVADEVGLLMIPEGAVWNDDEVYRIDDPAFWDNYADHLQRTVDHLKNHPSVIAYSLENEMYGARLNDASPAKAALVELGRKMKEWDPTRPITYESDLDPDGVADFIGLHYPHEYPDFNLYPNTCYWLDEPLRAPGGFTNGAGEWTWKRDKPLYIGEFLWVPSNDPSWHTIFFGDEAYTDYHRYRNLAKAWAWRMQIEAYRWYGVSGICPWTMFEGGPRLDEENPLFVACREAFTPIAAVVREYDTRFYASQEVPRTVTVYNDILSPSSLTLAWTLEGGGKVQAADQVKVALQPAERKTVSVILRTPEVAEPMPWTWRIRVLREGRVQQEQVKNYTVFPALGPWRLPTARIGLYDPNGRTRKVLTRQGVAFEEVAGLEDLLPPEGGEKVPYDLLIIGERTLRAGPRPRPVIGSVDPLAERLESFVRNGGRVLVLAQEAYPAHLFPTDLSNHAATLAFAQQPDHPLLRGIRGEDLRFWRGDHLVSEHNPVRPRTEGCRPIVTAGSAQGLDYAPVLEFPRGQGTLLLCQLKLVEKFAVEPIAARLLENALRYLITCRPAARPVAVVGDAAFQQVLRGYHLRFEDVTATLPEADLSRYSLLLVHADVQPLLQAAGRIRDFVERGGKVYLHALTPPAWNSLQPLVGASHLFLQPHRGPVVKDPQAPLARRLLHEDLYWLGERVGFPWSGAETPRSLRVAPFAFSKTLDPATAQVFEAEGMEVQALISGPTEGGVILATVGTLRQKIDFPESGAYVFGFRVGGSSVAGVFPLVEVRLDDRLVGTVSLTRGEYDLYTVWGTVSAGSHTLSLSFTNDAQVGGEDRNLWVDKLYVARDTAPESRNVTFLTQPPAVAQIQQGRGFYLVDEVCWDAEEINAHKAARYVTTLLTELGADFYRAGGALIEAEEMQPDPGIAWFRREGGAVSLGSGGTLRTTVECAQAGPYIFEIVGYSTPAEGQYGIVALAIDGRPVGEVELKAASWRGFPLEVTLAPGVHEIALTFTNDLYKPPEDRNVWLDRIEVYQAE